MGGFGPVRPTRFSLLILLVAARILERVTGTGMRTGTETDREYYHCSGRQSRKRTINSTQLTSLNMQSTKEHFYELFLVYVHGSIWTEIVQVSYIIHVS